MTGSLTASDLSVRYETPHGSVHALRHVDIEAHSGEVIGIVGESGCGKSTLVTAMANLLPANARIEGSISWNGVDVARLDAHRQRLLRGDEIALVSQDPMTAFNPVLTIGDQLVDFQHHRKDLGRAQKDRRPLRCRLTRPVALCFSCPHVRRVDVLRGGPWTLHE